MSLIFFKYLLLLDCYAVFLCYATNQKGIYKLPELVVETNSSYLVRGSTTQLECKIDSSNEWPNVTLDSIHWMKDGALVAELENENNELIDDVKGTLHIRKASHLTEGEYQCSSILRGIKLAEGKIVDSRLVSVPLKLRRARITKFERYLSETVRVKAGEVARLPCFGLPDVVPGPPDIWFEKQGNEGVQLGRTGNQRFISTPTGLQIALTQIADSGRYYCMVRNSFLNVTRAAPKPIVLKVDPSDKYRRPSELRKPKIIYPITRNNSEPIEVHVVEGETIILECVISDSIIRWNKLDYSMPKISIDNDRERIRQIWGNLRIKKVSISDADIYVCHGLKEYSDLELRQNDHPKVIYRLVVYAPTNVRLTLGSDSDKGWQLSCYAHNLMYEIPMVYINGLALIETMNEMGVPPQTNFYTNPINASIKNNPISGSVQCISRPAALEGEIYGQNLEIGRSINLYVDKQFHSDVLVVAGAQQDAILSTSTSTTIQTVSRQSGNVGLQKPIVFMASDNARIQWNIEVPDEKLSFLREFIVEFRQRDPRFDNSSVWVQSDRIPPHVKAVTLRRLNPIYQYQFRVGASFANGYARIYSSPTEWIGFVDPQATAPFTPRIIRLQTISHSSILVGWEHVTGSKLNAPEHFVVNCLDTETTEVKEIKVGSEIRELLITDLSPDSEYEIVVIAENVAGKSTPSKHKIGRTFALIGETSWTILNINGTIFLIFVTLISAAIPAICFLSILFVRKFFFSHENMTPTGNRRAPHEHRENIFSKNQLYQDPLFLNNDPLEELSPLNYLLNEPENDQLDKPFAHIRPDLQRGSQISLNNNRNGFRRLVQQQDIYGGASNTALNIQPSMFYNFTNENRPLINSSFQPIQSPLITRSTLSVFTHPNGRQQVQKRSIVIPETGSPFDQATVATTISPNDSSESSPKQYPPLPAPPRTNLRSAASNMELSNSFRPNNSMRTFGINPTLSQSQLYSAGPLF